jgi:hypothetical protein
MDDKTKKGSPDSKFINVNEDYEVEYWTKELNINKQELLAAVKAAGTSVAAVKEHLKKK